MGAQPWFHGEFVLLGVKGPDTKVASGQLQQCQKGATSCFVL